MLTALQPTRRRRLGELLIDAGVLDESRLQAALGEQKRWGGKLGRTLVEMGFVDEDSMTRTLSRQLNLQALDLDSVCLPPKMVELLRVDLCERYGVFPVGGDLKRRTLHLATSDPTNIEATRELSAATGSKIVHVVATGSAIDRAIRRYYYGEALSPRPATGEAKASPLVSVGPSPSASVDLDQLLGHGLLSTEEGALKTELAQLRGQIDRLQKVTAGQVAAIRALTELLIESGLVSRDEYLVKLHR